MVFQTMELDEVTPEKNIEMKKQSKSRTEPWYTPVFLSKAEK